MSAPPRPDLRACTQCRLTFSCRRSLRRHEALDHRPAPDGAFLTAQLVGGSSFDLEPAVLSSADAPAASVRLSDPPAPTLVAAPSRQWRPIRTRPPVWVVAVVVGLAALVLGLGVTTALTASVLVWSHWARWPPSRSRGVER